MSDCEEFDMGGLKCPAGNCCRPGFCRRDDSYSKDTESDSKMTNGPQPIDRSPLKSLKNWEHKRAKPAA